MVKEGLFHKRTSEERSDIEKGASRMYQVEEKIPGGAASAESQKAGARPALPDQAMGSVQLGVSELKEEKQKML